MLMETDPFVTCTRCGTDWRYSYVLDNLTLFEELGRIGSNIPRCFVCEDLEDENLGLTEEQRKKIHNVVLVNNLIGDFSDFIDNGKRYMDDDEEREVLVL